MPFSKRTCFTVGDASEENDEDLLGDNFRPTQPLNGRIVSSYNDFGRL